jgi:WhiB family redox-sensing transcriptional regulator
MSREWLSVKGCAKSLAATLLEDGKPAVWCVSLFRERVSDLGITSLLFQPVEWHRRAACTGPGVDPETFFPERGGSSKAARAICARWPVSEECLAYALESREGYGIWGNASERERRVRQALVEAAPRMFQNPTPAR